MNSPDEFRSKRSSLMARAAVERERLVMQLQTWEAPFALADKGLAAARFARQNPHWIAAAAVLLMVLRPRRALSWARNGLIAWRAWRWISQSLRGLASRRPA